jgi:ketosteroid isomerase-like protein
MDDLAVLKHGDTYVARFDLYINGNGTRVFVGTRKLFLRYDDDVFSVIGDEYPQVPRRDPVAPSADETPILAALDVLTSGGAAEVAAAEESPAPVSELEIASMVDRWLAAWSSKNIDAYGDFYAEDFRSQGKDRKAWLRHKAQLNRQYDYIRVTRETDLTVDAGDPDRPVVSFTQHYDSSGYSATGRKRLVLTQQGDEWKIFRETWRRR